MSRERTGAGGALVVPAFALLACLTLIALSGRVYLPMLPAHHAWIELLLPGLGAQGAAPATALFDVPAPPPGANLVSAASASSLGGHEHGRRGATPASPYLGLLPPLLALYALLAGRDRSGRRRLVGSAGSPAAAPLARWAAGLALVGLGLYATLPGVYAGIAWTLCLWGLVETARPREDEDDALPTLLLGAACVILTGALAGLALHAGATPDRELLTPLLARLEPSQREAWTPSMLSLNAAHLRAVLDRSALAAFAGMAALLLHLKTRRMTTGLLIVAVIAADLLTAAPS